MRLETLVLSHVMMVMNWVVVKLGPVRVMALGVELMLHAQQVSYSTIVQYSRDNGGFGLFWPKISPNNQLHNTILA